MTSKEIDILFATAVAEWREQGRTDEQIYAVDNFISGRGVKLRKDLLALVQQARVEEVESIYKHFQPQDKDFDHASYDWVVMLITARLAELKGETK